MNCHTEGFKEAKLKHYQYAVSKGILSLDEVVAIKEFYVMNNDCPSLSQVAKMVERSIPENVNQANVIYAMKHNEKLKADMKNTLFISNVKREVTTIREQYQGNKKWIWAMAALGCLFGGILGIFVPKSMYTSVNSLYKRHILERLIYNEFGETKFD